MGSRMREEASVPGTENVCPPPHSPHPALPTCPANTGHLNNITHQEGETVTPF